MSFRPPRALLAIVGVLALLAAAALHFWVAPSLSKLPDDVNVTADYAGTMSVADAATGKLGAPADIQVSKNVKVLSTSGNTAITQVVTTTTTPAGTGNAKGVFAVDRTTQGQAVAPSGTEVTDQKGGLTVGRPVNPGPGGFTVYDALTQTAIPVAYVGESSIAGRQVYEFTGKTTAPVADPAQAAQLQAGVAKLAPGEGKTLPKLALAAIGTTLPAAQRVPFEQMLTQLPEQVPLSYLATVDQHLWIDKQLGTVIKATSVNDIGLNIAGPKPVPLMPLLRTDVAQTPQSSQQITDQTASSATKLAWMQNWIPLILAILGAALLLLSVISFGRRGHAITHESLPSTPPTKTPTGV